jgi:hypothetical protein
MRRIESTRAFKRDYKRVKATPKHRDIETFCAKSSSFSLPTFRFPNATTIIPFLASGRIIGIAT